MSEPITGKEKVKLVRAGNELFNKGEVEKAAKLFWATDYKDGLIRVGEYLMDIERKPFQALQYFQKANHHKKVQEIMERMIWALSKWVKEK